MVEKKTKEKTKQTVPEIISLGLKVLRKWHGETQKSLSKALNTLPRRKLYNSAHISETTISNLERGMLTPLKYCHLEAYQEVTGIPIGIFLTATHITALARDNNITEFNKYITGLLNFNRDLLKIRFDSMKEGMTEEELELMLKQLFRAYNDGVKKAEKTQRRLSKKHGKNE